LSQSEVEKLAKSGLVEDSVEFVPNPLVYMVHATKESNQIEVSFRNGWITIGIPEKMTKEWAAGDQVGLEGAFRGVTVLIEKDWACLHADEAANEDTFARPDLE
jgi:hypothetical protein